VAVVARKEWQQKFLHQAGGLEAPFDDAQEIGAGDRPVGQGALAFQRGANEGGLVGLAGQSGRLHVGFHLLAEIVPRRQKVDLGVFFLSPRKPSIQNY
jgi:hypothetical protein